MPRPRAAGLAIWLILLAPSAFLAWPFRGMHQLGTTVDDEIYLVSAKSLAAGTGYRTPNLPGDPYQTKFPVLYPLLLSVVWRLAPAFPANLPAFALLAWLVMPVYLALAKRLFRSFGFPESEAWVMCALVAISPELVVAGVTLGPDLMFSALLLVIFLVLRDPDGGSAGRVLLAGALGGLAYLVRTAALPLAATAPLYFLWRKRPARAGLFLAGMLPFILGWSLWARSHMARGQDVTTIFYADYLGDFLQNFSWGSLPAVIGRNFAWVVEYAGMLTAWLPWTAALWVCGAMAALGALRLIRRTGLTQYHLFAAAYGAMLVLWVGKPLPRYLIPVLPLLAAGVVDWAATSRRRTPALAALLFFCAAFSALGYAVHFADLKRYARDAADERKVYAWIRSQTLPTAKFVAFTEGVLYLYTGRQATRYEFLKKNIYTGGEKAWQDWREALPRFARERGLEYAFCDARYCPGAALESQTAAARAVLEKHYREVFRSGPATVYKLE